MARQNLFQAFRCAFAGIMHCIRRERNMKIHVGAMLAVLFLAWRSDLSHSDWALLIITIAFVLSAEMFNTAIEAVVDLMIPEYHLLAKIAKDVAAGAVLVSAFASLAVGYLLFFHSYFVDR